MRRMLVAWLMAIPCGVVLGQEPVRPADLVPRPQPPHPVASQAAPSSEKVEHLLIAATHLDAAGLHDNATKLRQQAEQESQAPKTELESLRAEVQRLRQPTGDNRQVLVHLKVVELSPEKLRRLGMDFSAASADRVPQPRFDFSGPASAVVDAKLLDGFVTALQHDSLARVLAEPNIVTLNGRPASFLSGGEFPVPSLPSDGSESTEFRPYGTQFNFCPTILPDRRVYIDLCLSVSELDERHTIKTQNAVVPGMRSRQLNTQVIIPFGQTLVLSGPITPSTAKQEDSKTVPNQTPAAAKEVPDRKQLLVLITPQIVGVMSASTASATR